MSDIELLDIAGDDLDMDRVRSGEPDPCVLRSAYNQLRCRSLPQRVPRDGSITGSTPDTRRTAQSDRTFFQWFCI